jgi:hypothetical protein
MINDISTITITFRQLFRTYVIFVFPHFIFFLSLFLMTNNKRTKIKENIKTKTNRMINLRTTHVGYFK